MRDFNMEAVLLYDHILHHPKYCAPTCHLTKFGGRVPMFLLINAHMLIFKTLMQNI